MISSQYFQLPVNTAGCQLMQEAVNRCQQEKQTEYRGLNKNVLDMGNKDGGKTVMVIIRFGKDIGGFFYFVLGV